MNGSEIFGPKGKTPFLSSKLVKVILNLSLVICYYNFLMRGPGPEGLAMMTLLGMVLGMVLLRTLMMNYMQV